MEEEKKLQRTEYYYASDNALQNVAVWQFPPAQVAEPLPGAKKYWLIFIHGGAWRDPRATFDEAEPTITTLLSRGDGHLPQAAARLAGVASLNYRLSAHPDFGQSAAHTPSFGTRTARHPDHLADVLAGLRFLQAQFGFGAEYVLAGHSAGATLCFQVLLGAACLGGRGGSAEERFEDVQRPAAVVGFEGIYDLAGLNRRKSGKYAAFMEGAFGRDDGASWAAASPATAAGSFAASWSEGGGARLAVLAQSEYDELVDMAECATMEARLRRDGVRNLRVYKDLKGEHFEVLEDGSIARVLSETWLELERLDKA